MSQQQVLVDFPGRIVIVGFGSIGQGVLPLILRHIGITAERITIITAEDVGAEEAARYGVKFIKQRLTRENFRRTPWPVAPAADGSHLHAEWDRTQTSVHAGAALESTAGIFADQLANGPLAWWGLHAAMQYPATERLRLISQPTLLIRSREGRSVDNARVRDLLLRAQVVEQPDIYGSDLFESAAAPLSTVLREFLRG